MRKYTVDGVSGTNVGTGVGSSRSNGMGFSSEDNSIGSGTEIYVGSNGDNIVHISIKFDVGGNLKEELVYLDA